jgi:acetyl esterase/lipase
VALAALAVLLAGCGGSSITIRTTPSHGGGGPRAIWGAPLDHRPPRALVFLIHGGGWTGINAPALQSEVELAQLFRRLGFETVAVEYRRGAPGIDDVERFYLQARKRVGPKLPICAVGPSAGGHIALMLAVLNPDLKCVISQAGPTDLPALETNKGGANAYKLATQAFGTGSLLAKESPALHASSIKARLMLVYAQNDPVVPAAQGYEMKRADPAAKLIVLPPGPAPFVHTGVGAPPSQTGVAVAAKQAASQAEVKFLYAMSRS